MKITYLKKGALGKQDNVNDTANFCLFMEPETTKEAVDMEWCLANFNTKSIQRTSHETPTYSISFTEKL